MKKNYSNYFIYLLINYCLFTACKTPDIFNENPKKDQCDIFENNVRPLRRETERAFLRIRSSTTK